MQGIAVKPAASHVRLKQRRAFPDRGSRYTERSTRSALKGVGVTVMFAPLS